MKFRDGPAAVIGDEIHYIATVLIGMGRCGWRLIRESEDLPETLLVILGKGASNPWNSGLKKGYPGSINNWSGVFISQTGKWGLS